MLYNLLKDKIRLWSVTFVKAIIPIDIVRSKTIKKKRKFNIWEIRKDKVFSLTITRITWLKGGDILKVKVLDAKQEVGPSNRQAPYQQQSSYPTIQ